MKLLMILTCLLGIGSAYAGEEAPLIIPIKEYNPQQKYNRRICIVDMFGEMECKDPERAPNDPLAKPKYVKGPNQAYEGDFMISALGYYKGFLFQGRKHTGRWSYGLALRGYMYSSGDEEAASTTELMLQGTLNFHFFPRWYSSSPSHKQFDMGVTMQVGYDYVSGDEIADIQSSPVVSAGVFASYPVSDSIRVVIQFENLQAISPAKNRGTIGSFGIGFDF